MNFDLNADQLALQESLQRFLAGEYDFERRRKILRAPLGCSEEIWAALAEQGALAIGLPEAHGGFGGPVEVMLIMEEIGKSLVLEPFMSTVVLCGALLAECGSERQQKEIFAGIASGKRRLALGHYEEASRYEMELVETTARIAADRYVLNGAKSVVLDGAVAHQFIVSARLQPEGRLVLLLLDAGTPGVEIIAYRTQDGRNAADLRLRDASVPGANLLESASDPARGSLPAIRRALDRALAALCAEAVGAMEALNAATLEYLKSRRQFGQPIGRFQALQHRMADMFIYATQARSMSLLATGRCTMAEDAPRRNAVSAAKAFIGKAARFVGQEAVQLHGGMGMADELPVSHYFKRLTMINATFGDVDHHVTQVSDAIRETGTEAQP
jgi:alkylation response protein AidB-like acyl-CoA dehydrogenase